MALFDLKYFHILTQSSIQGLDKKVKKFTFHLFIHPNYLLSLSTNGTNQKSEGNYKNSHFIF